MAIPSAAYAFVDKMDPSDLVDFEVILVGEGTEEGLLAADEEVGSYTLTVHPEAVALGLTIATDPARAPKLLDEDTVVRFWLEIAPEYRQLADFNSGVRMPLELEIVTDSAPFRRRQRTLVVEVIHL